MRRTMLVLTVATLTALVFVAPALAAPGDLDTSFGDDGQVSTPVNSSGDWATDVVVQPDGKILSVGSATDGTDVDFALIRQNPDGTLDDSFDSDGKLTTDFGAADAASAVALQPDDKIVVIGYSGGRFAVARYNPDGSLDDTFDDDGKVTTDFENGEARDLAIQPDGKIVVAGIEAGSNENFVVVRYNADGSLDTDFDSDGKLTTDFSQNPTSSPGQDNAWALALQPDGKILVGGTTTLPATPTSDTKSDFALARYNADGSLDTDFDGDGKLTTDFSGGSFDQALGLALAPDGKIVLVGSYYGGASVDFAMARYNADGTLDTDLDSDGKLTTDFSPAGDDTYDEAWDVDIQADGKLVVAGESDVLLATARYNEDGSLDSSFGNGGKGDLSTAISRPALALDLNGKLVLAGGRGGGFNLVRAYGGDDRTPPAPVTALSADAQENDVSLSWTNPQDDFEATRIVRSSGGYATGPLQQTKVYEGNAASFTDANLSSGTYYYTAFARDDNGNWSEAATASILVADPDSTPPETNILSGPNGPTNDSTPTFTYDGSDNVTPSTDLLYSYKVVPGGANPDGVAWSDYSSSTSATLGGTTGLGQGSYTFYVRASDQTGNEDGSPASRSFTVDTTPPAAPTITSPANNAYDTDGVVTLSGTAGAGTTVQVFEGAALRGAPVAVNTGGAWSATLSGVADGSHTYTAKATDAAGNTSAASASRTVRVDTIRPTGTVTINGGAASTKNRKVTLTLSATDPAPASGVARMRFRNENTSTWSAWQTYTTSKSWTLSSGAGTKTVYVQFEDRAGNNSTQARDTIRFAP